MQASFFFYPQNILYFVVAFTNLFIGIYLFGKHKFGNNFYFLLIYAAIFIWTFGIGMRSSIVGVEQKMFWTKIAYIGIVTTPIFFLFTIRSMYIKEKFLKSQWAGLVLAALALLVLIFTDSQHHLFWIGQSETPNEWNYIHYTGGPVYWINTLFQFVIGANVIYILLKARQNPLYTACSEVFLWSIVPPILTNIMFSVGLTFLPDYNVAPLGFLLTGAIMAVGFRNIKLFDLAGVGIDQFLSDMRHGIVIAGSDGRIMMINPVAQKVLELKEGANLEESSLLSKWLTTSKDHQAEISSNQFETYFADEHFYIDLKTYPITNMKGVVIGDLIVLNNITDEKKIANVAKISQVNKIKSEERERLAKELQDRIAQGLYALMILTKSAQNHALDGILGRTFDDLEDLLSMTQQLVKNVNLLYYELDDDAFGKIGLIQALQDQIQIQKYQSNISIDLVNFDKIQLSTPDQRTIYGIIVGVLNEVLKLSKPVSIVINISETSKNFMIKFMIYEKNLQPGLLTVDRVEGKFVNLLETIHNINGIFEFSTIDEGQKLINVQLPRK